MKETIRRMFSRKAPENVTKSIRCPLGMWEALEALAKQQGETANSYVILVLDQFLQLKVNEGKIDAPILDAPEKSAS